MGDVETLIESIRALVADRQPYVMDGAWKRLDALLADFDEGKEKAERRGVDEILDFMPGTLEMLLDLEKRLKFVPKQQATEVAAVLLWRVVRRYPGIWETVGDMASIRIQRGGRDVRVEVEATIRAVGVGEPAVKWRGSVTDLVTDIAPLLDKKKLAEFVERIVMVERKRAME